MTKDETHTRFITVLRMLQEQGDGPVACQARHIEQEYSYRMYDGPETQEIMESYILAAKLYLRNNRSNATALYREVCK